MDCKNMILSDEYADLILDFNEVVTESELQDFCTLPIEEDLILYYQKRRLDQLFPLSRYRRSYLPNLYAPMQLSSSLFPTSALEESSIAQVNRPPLNLNGLGTRIAIIDTGINYTNPAFLTEFGDSRIIALWDQEDQSHTPPEGFLYGSFYGKDLLDESLLSSAPETVILSKDIPSGHGTSLAGIAAGNPNPESDFRGVAPLSSLIVVKLKQAKPYLKDYYRVPRDAVCYEEGDIIAALKFVTAYNEPFQTPLCILIGVGTSYGNHNGDSILERYINRLCSRPNIAVVCPGGNEGNTAHHARVVFPDTESSPAEVEFNVSDGNQGFILQCYASLPNRFSFAIRSPLGEEFSGITPDLTRSLEYRFLYDESSLLVDYITSAQPGGEDAVFLHIQSPSPGIWKLFITPDYIFPPATVDMYLPLKEFLSSEVIFITPSPLYTLTAPSMAEHALCIAAYGNNRATPIPFASRGFLRNGNIKPDIAAIGTNVESPLGPVDGSSAAAALAAGAAALLLEWAVVRRKDPFITGEQLKNLFIRGAYRLPNGTYPNPENGYGFLNLNGIFERLR